MSYFVRMIRAMHDGTRKTLTVALLLGTSVLGANAFAASPQTSKPFATVSFNVFLGPWRVIGPFPKPSSLDGSGLRTAYLPDEADGKPVGTVNYQGRAYTWQPYGGRVLDFQRAFGATNDLEQVVAYAWTSFRSDKEQDAVLAIGSDDGARAWLNGKLILHHPQIRACDLDDDRIPVRLRKGENVLLLKVENATKDWGALARLLPPHVEQPLLTLDWRSTSGLGSYNLYELPDLSLDFLSRDDRVLSRHRVSGFRVDDGDKVLFRLYAKAPQPEPAKVRVEVNQSGYIPLTQIIAWATARASVVAVNATGNCELSGRVIDARSGQPIPGARLRTGESATPVQSSADGTFHLQGLQPLTSQLIVGAAGHKTSIQSVRLPAQGKIEVRLTPGGREFYGQVTDEAGHPIKGAKVWVSAQTPMPQDSTDGNGRFLLSGLPDSATQIFPVVEHPDYSPLMHFSEQLTGTSTTGAVYKMQRAVVVTGRVTAKSDGRPLSGIQIVSGSDRFASNTSIPQTETDMDGRYRLHSVAAGGALVHAFSDRFAPAMQTVTAEPGGRAEADFALDEGKDVTGGVTDTKGDPIPDVWVVSDTWSGARMFHRETRTDQEGRFHLDHMPDTPVLMNALKTGYVSDRQLTVVGGQEYVVVLKPVVKHLVTLRLKDTGKPPETVDIQRGYRWEGGRDRVSWQAGNPYEGKWNPTDGVFTVALAETGNYETLFRFRVTGYKDAVVTIPRDAREPQTFDVAMEPAVQVVGHVVSAKTGEPVEGVTVTLVSDQDRVPKQSFADLSQYWADLEFPGPHTESAADGSFALTGPDPGTDLLLIRKNGGFLFIRDAGSVIQNGAMELPFPEPATVRGRVLVHGEPAPNEKINIQWRPPGDEQAWSFPFQFGGNLQTDAQGRFEITGLGPGRYQISRVKETPSPGGTGNMSSYTDIRNLVLLPGQIVEIDLNRAPGFEFSGRTLDAAGKPLGDCIVRLYDAQGGGGIDVVRSDEEGNFRVADVPNGLIGVMAEHHPTGSGNMWQADATANRMISMIGPVKTDLHLRPVPQTETGAARQGMSLVGTIPPDFTAAFVNTNGSFTLSDQLGKVVAMDFWATWCGPCMMQVPEVKRVWEKYRNNPGVVFVSVSLDSDTNELRKVMQQKGLDFPVIWSGESWNSAVATTFGVNAIPMSFVIGRNGRFRSEPSHSGGLDGLIESALAEAPDPGLTGATKLARLDIDVAFASDGGNVPRATVEVAAFDATGKSVKSEKLPMPGHATRLRWMYPPVGTGGKILVSVTAPDLPKQAREIDGPKESDKASFTFVYPRTIRGRLVVQGTGVPAVGLKVNASNSEGSGSHSGMSDTNGLFTIPVVPGTYYLQVEGNEHIAAPNPPISEPTTVEVAADVDPPEQRIELLPAVTIQGRIVDDAGKPVADAKVTALGSRTPATAGSDGRFELSGVPATGPVTLLAGKDKPQGRLQLATVDTNEVYTVRLSDLIHEARRALSEGDRIPDLKLLSLTGGKPFAWRPAQDENTLLIFCALWHPLGRRMLDDAIKNAGRQGVHLVVCSTDLTLDQALRQLHSSPVSTRVFYAGSDSSVQEAWHVGGPAQAFLVSGDGKVLQTPAPGRLP